MSVDLSNITVTVLRVGAPSETTGRIFPMSVTEKIIGQIKMQASTFQPIPVVEGFPNHEGIDLSLYRGFTVDAWVDHQAQLRVVIKPFDDPRQLHLFDTPDFKYTVTGTGTLSDENVVNDNFQLFYISRSVK